jgi:hypothetical protein
MRDERHPSSASEVLSAFNMLSNSGGDEVSILIVDAREAAEGVSFLAVRRLYLASPPSSWPAYLQLVGRAVRSFSHHALDQSQRTVATKMYVAILPQVDVACNNCL